jgi:hypothetical protein
MTDHGLCRPVASGLNRRLGHHVSSAFEGPFTPDPDALPQRGTFSTIGQPAIPSDHPPADRPARPRLAEYAAPSMPSQRRTPQTLSAPHLRLARDVHPGTTTTTTRPWPSSPSGYRLADRNIAGGYSSVVRVLRYRALWGEGAPAPDSRPGCRRAGRHAHDGVHRWREHPACSFDGICTIVRTIAAVQHATAARHKATALVHSRRDRRPARPRRGGGPGKEVRGQERCRL